MNSKSKYLPNTDKTNELRKEMINVLMILPLSVCTYFCSIIPDTRSPYEIFK